MEVPELNRPYHRSTIGSVCPRCGVLPGQDCHAVNDRHARQFPHEERPEVIIYGGRGLALREWTGQNL